MIKPFKLPEGFKFPEGWGTIETSEKMPDGSFMIYSYLAITATTRHDSI